MAKTFTPYSQIDPEHVQFTLGTDRTGKASIQMSHRTGELGVLSAPAVTQWPRCSGDGNYGTMWGPTDPNKAKFTLDLSDQEIAEAPNTEFVAFAAKLTAVDDMLLDFVHEHQQRILGRKNLTRDEVKMLQIRSVRPKFDKISGLLVGHSVNLTVSKYAWDGLGGKYARAITICDKDGKTVNNGSVAPGDIVQTTMYANLVYTGVGGDKFGIHWAFQDVMVICQRAHLVQKSEVSAFQGHCFSFAKPYQQDSEQQVYNASEQFPA